MRIIKRTATYESTSKAGRPKYWFAEAIEEEGCYYTRTVWWQTLVDGSQSRTITSEPTLITAKNVGRSNEIAEEQQAIIELEQLILKQRNKGYHLEDEAPRQTIAPMLAHPYEKKIKHVKWPLYVQPKYNGVRAIFDSETFTSRQCKEFPADCTRHLVMDLAEEIYPLDGELMIPHQEATFQETISAVKKYREELSPRLRYFVYDVVIENTTFQERLNYLRELFDNLPQAQRGLFVLAPTYRVANQSEMLLKHGAFVEHGYEGTILRNPNGLYEIGHRSNDLLKFKDFIDEEFEIVDFSVGTGKFSEVPIFVVKVAEGILCEVVPKGTQEYRKELLKNAKLLIGKLMTVRYQCKTDDGSLLFPVGVAIRDYE